MFRAERVRIVTGGERGRGCPRKGDEREEGGGHRRLSAGSDVSAEL